MKISLVVCTRNRASALQAALERIMRVECPAPWELVIVDNGSTDNTCSVVDHFRGRFQQKLLTVVEPRVGTGRAHNTGWTVANGDIIAFTDDDCYPEKTFLTSVCQCFDENENLGFVGGRVLLYDKTDYRITIQEQAHRELLKPGSFVPAGFIHGANLSFRRSALISVGGFDDRFGAGTAFVCEDVDIQARILARGWHGVYDPRPMVYHHHRRKTEADANQLTRKYDHGRGAYYVKCLLDKKIRGTYLINWLRLIRRQPRRTTFRELFAGATFYVQTVLKQS